MVSDVGVSFRLPHQFVGEVGNYMQLLLPLGNKMQPASMKLPITSSGRHIRSVWIDLLTIMNISHSLCLCLVVITTLVIADELDSFKAIQTLHSKLDDDADGEVNDEESKRFLQADKNKDSTITKLRYLHQDGKDTSISVHELWEAWKSSQVHNWTTDETIYWLVNYVELPEYSDIFEQHSINGSLLPRLATEAHFISRLGITDSSARHKISIKAMDVVLFGPPKLATGSRARDIILSIVAIIAITTCCFFYNRAQASHRVLLATQEKMESLQKAEDEMSKMEQELEKALKAHEAVATEKKNLEHQLEMQRQFSASNLSETNSISSNKQLYSNGDSINGKQNSSKDFQDLLYVAKLEEDIKSLRDELQKTYDSIAAKKFRAPLALRTLLQNTYNVESQYYNEKKLNLETKANQVKLRNQKRQKKKASFLGYYKMAQENSLEEDINSIVEVKEAIMQVTREIKERTERWRAIEELCGCSLIIN